MAAPLTSAGDPRAPDVRPAADGRSGHGACCGRRREGRGRAAESPPPSRGEGRERSRRGGGGGAPAGCGLALTLAVLVGGVGDPNLTLGRGARAEPAGSAQSVPHPDIGPTPAWGPRVGEKEVMVWGRPRGSAFPPQVSPCASDILGAQQLKSAPAVPGSARGACLPSVHFCYLRSSQCQLCHRVDVEQQVPAPHRASVFPLYNRRVGQSNLVRVEKCDGALGPPGGGFLCCARILPTKGRAAADG